MTPCPKSSLQTLIDNVLTHRPDLLTFIHMLEQEGVTCKPNSATTGKMNGFSFQYQGIAFKASQLGKKYGWSSLQTLIDFTPEHLVLLKQVQKPTVPASVPVPSCEPEEQAVNRETILEKILQLEEKIRLERQQEIVGIFQLRSKLHNTARQIPRQRRLKAWLLLLSQIVVFLRRRGMSLLHATAHPFRKILHVELLNPVYVKADNYLN